MLQPRRPRRSPITISIRPSRLMAIGWMCPVTGFAGNQVSPWRNRDGGLIAIAAAGFIAIADGTGIRIIRGDGLRFTTGDGAALLDSAGSGFPIPPGDRAGSH